MDPRAARRLLLLWLASALLFTLHPYGPLGEPKAFIWNKPSFAGLFDCVANLLLFLPLGPLGRAAALSPRAVLPAAAAVSLLVELAQARLPDRLPAYADLFFNVGGAAAGTVFADGALAVAPRLCRPRACFAMLMLGGAGAAALALRYPQLAKLGWLFPCAIAALASLVGSGLLRPAGAFLLGWLGGVGVASLLRWPASVTNLWTCAVAALLGAWPAAGRRPRPLE
ncbi:MAG: VanZ family protein, partial [Planctomycetota bacterium]